jgi:hypothetical protein
MFACGSRGPRTGRSAADSALRAYCWYCGLVRGTGPRAMTTNGVSEALDEAEGCPEDGF